MYLKILYIYIEHRNIINLKYHGLVKINLVPLIPLKLMKISIPNFNILLRDIFGFHLFTRSGNRRVYTDS